MKIIMHEEWINEWKTQNKCQSKEAAKRQGRRRMTKKKNNFGLDIILGLITKFNKSPVRLFGSATWQKKPMLTNDVDGCVHHTNQLYI